MTTRRDVVGHPPVPLEQSGSVLDTRRSATPSVATNHAEQTTWDADVLRALECLARLDRAALRLIYWGGLTEAQVARQLALPEPTVRTHVAPGMRELAAYLARGGAAANRHQHRMEAQ